MTNVQLHLCNILLVSIGTTNGIRVISKTLSGKSQAIFIYEALNHKRSELVAAFGSK